MAATPVKATREAAGGAAGDGKSSPAIFRRSRAAQLPQLAPGSEGTPATAEAALSAADSAPRSASPTLPPRAPSTELPGASPWLPAEEVATADREVLCGRASERGNRGKRANIGI